MSATKNVSLVHPQSCTEAILNHSVCVCVCVRVRVCAALAVFNPLLILVFGCAPQLKPQKRYIKLLESFIMVLNTRQYQINSLFKP